MPVAVQIGLAIVMMMLVSFAQVELSRHGTQLILTLPAQLLSGIWAAWDANKIGISKYKTRMSAQPVLIGIFCVLFWIVAFPMYLFARNKVLTGKAALKDPTTAGQQSKKARNLLIFTAVVLGLGGVYLFCQFAPNINPSFVEGSVFQALTPVIQEVTLDEASGSEKEYLADIFQRSNGKFTDNECHKLGVPKPSEATFKAKDGTQLHGWLFEKQGASDVVLFSPSGFGDASLSVYLCYVKTLLNANLSVFIYDYQHGKPNENPHFQNALDDGRAALQYLVNEKHVNAGHLIFMGRDIGAYISCQLCKEVKPKALILEEPWTSLKANIELVSPAMKMVPASCYPLECLDNMTVLQDQHRVPVFIIGTGERRSESFRIYEKIAGSKAFIHLVDMDSISFPDLREQGDRLTARIKSFIASPPAQVAAATKSDTSARTTAVTATPVAWKADVVKAQSDAKSQKKYVLIDFYTDWCGWCKRLDRDTYANASVEQFLKSNFICVKVNADDKETGEAIAQKFGVRSFPDIIIMDSSGKVAGRYHGYLGPAAFLEQLKEIAMQ